MPGIDLSIVFHEIKTYSDAKPIRQILRQINQRKVAAIKTEVEKLLHAGFICPIPLMDCVGKNTERGGVNQYLLHNQIFLLFHSFKPIRYFPSVN